MRNLRCVPRFKDFHEAIAFRIVEDCCGSPYSSEFAANSARARTIAVPGIPVLEIP